MGRRRHRRSHGVLHLVSISVYADPLPLPEKPTPAFADTRSVERVPTGDDGCVSNLLRPASDAARLGQVH